MKEEGKMNKLISSFQSLAQHNKERKLFKHKKQIKTDPPPHLKTKQKQVKQKEEFTKEANY